MSTSENEPKQSPVVITGNDGESIVVAAHPKGVVLQLSIPGRNARTAEIQLETEGEVAALDAALVDAARIAFGNPSMAAVTRSRQEWADAALAKDLGTKLEAMTIDAERYKADHLSACALIAQMHAAATGKPGDGPIRGVVEDVADLRERAVALESALVALLSYADHHNADPEGDCSCGLNDVRATIQELIA